MYIAKRYVGDYKPGECIPDGVLEAEQVEWLESTGAIKAAPVKPDAPSKGNPEETPVEDAPVKKTTRKRRKAE